MTVFKKCDKASIQRPITSSNFVVNQCKVHTQSGKPGQWLVFRKSQGKPEEALGFCGKSVWVGKVREIL